MFRQLLLVKKHHRQAQPGIVLQFPAIPPQKDADTVLVYLWTITIRESTFVVFTITNTDKIFSVFI